MIGSASHSYRIAPQEQPPVNGMFMVVLLLIWNFSFDEFRQ